MKPHSPRDDPERLAATLRRTVYGGGGDVAAPALAAYMLAADRVLAATPVDRVIAGKIAWPAIVAPAPLPAEEQP